MISKLIYLLSISNRFRLCLCFGKHWKDNLPMGSDICNRYATSSPNIWNISEIWINHKQFHDSGSNHGWWADNLNLLTSTYCSEGNILIRSSQNFCTMPHAMTFWTIVACAILWFDWIIRIRIRANKTFHKTSLMSSLSVCHNGVNIEILYY